MMRSRRSSGRSSKLASVPPSLHRRDSDGYACQEERISIHRQAAKDAKKAYEDAVLSRASCQREVNDLLQRKSSWTDNDVLRFTALVRQDHLNEQGEALAKSTLESREADVEKEFNELMRAILNRYHEEQVWSDKIRSASTYGSLLALGANIFVFILAIVLVEPYKRKRLAQTFEKRIEEVSQETKVTISEAMVGLENHFKEQQMVLSSIQQIHSNTTTPTPETPVPQERPEAQQNIPPNWLGAPQSQATKLIGSFVGGGATACVIMAISMGRS